MFTVQTFAVVVPNQRPAWQESRQGERRWFTMADAIKADRGYDVRRTLRSFAKVRQL